MTNIPSIFQIKDQNGDDQEITIVTRVVDGRLVIAAHPRLKSSDDPWYDAVGAVIIEFRGNKVEVSLYDRDGIETDTPHFEGEGGGSPITLATDVIR